MSAGVLIEDDPDHPEGGYARVVFRGVTLPSARAALLVESLTEGFDYLGPQRIESAALPVADSGVELRIGPDVVGALKQGLAVHLALEGTGKGFDVLWPELTPPRAAPRRSALSTGKPKRRVAVEDAGPGLAVEPEQSFTKVTTPSTNVVDDPKTQDPRSADPKDQYSKVQDPKDPDPKTKETTPKVEALAGVGGISTNPQTSDTTTTGQASARATPAYDIEKTEKPKREKSSGWSLPRVAAVGAVAFGAGAGSIALMAPKLALVPTIEAKGDLALPSPYAMLADLPSRSPDGLEMKASESAKFRDRGEHASSEAEAQFWRRWAMRALLNSHTKDAAAVLNDFATTVATSPKADSNAVAARFIWELAALGNDCAAMDNIAAALSLPGAPDASDAIATWRKRAKSCRKLATSTR